MIYNKTINWDGGLFKVEEAGIGKDGYVYMRFRPMNPLAYDPHIKGRFVQRLLANVRAHRRWTIG